VARILWIACAQPGSLFPAVPIALELSRRGHELTALCEPRSQTMFESLGFAMRERHCIPAALAHSTATYGAS
jgi:UDP:flavonoid glycosyltransferase YjiC (YdhE family)